MSDVDVVDEGAERAIPSFAELGGSDQVDHNAPAHDVDVRMRRRLGDQRPGDRGAGGIGYMQNAPVAVSALARQVGRVVLPVEGEPQADHMLDGLRRTSHGHAHRRLDAQAAAGRHRVGNVGVEAVVGRGHRGDAALRPVGRTAPDGILGQHRHPGMVSQMQRRRQTGGAAADDEDVSAMSLRHAREPAVLPFRESGV